MIARAHLPLLTPSSLKTYRRCPRLYRLRCVDGYRTVSDEETLRFGSLMHVGLEAWWLALQAGMAGDDVLAHALEAIDGRGVDGFEQVRADCLLIGYHVRWIDEPLDVLAVEEEFRAPLVNPDTGAKSATWQRAGKIDVIVCERPTARVLVVEHKTSSEDVTAGSDYWKRLRMDGQVSSYFVGARALGHDVAATLYDVIAKPTIRPAKATPVEDRKYTKEKFNKATGQLEPSRLYAGQRDADETSDEFRERLTAAIAAEPWKFYARGEVVRIGDELREHMADDWQTAVTIRSSLVAKPAPRFPRNPDACKAFGRTCEFFDACTGVASLDDPERFRRVAHVHSELTSDEASKGTQDAA